MTFCNKLQPQTKRLVPQWLMIDPNWNLLKDVPSLGVTGGDFF